MSNTSQQQKSSTRTKNITDSYNTNETVNRIFDNVGNSEVYINSDQGSVGGNQNNTSLIIAGALIAGALIIGKD